MSSLDNGNRREFLKSLGRHLMLGTLLAGGAVLMKRPVKKIDNCISDGICSRCKVLTGCGLPQALSVRQAHQAKSGE